MSSCVFVCVSEGVSVFVEALFSNSSPQNLSNLSGSNSHIFSGSSSYFIAMVAPAPVFLSCEFSALCISFAIGLCAPGFGIASSAEAAAPNT